MIASPGALVITANPHLQGLLPELLTSNRFDIRGVFNSCVDAASDVKRHDVNVVVADASSVGEYAVAQLADELRSEHHAVVCSILAPDAGYPSTVHLPEQQTLRRPFSAKQFAALLDEANRVLAHSHPQKSYVRLLDRKQCDQVQTSTILHIQAFRNYLDVVHEHGRCTIRSTLQAFLLLLPEVQFVKCHRSFIVNVDKINYLSSGSLVIGDVVIPVSKRAFSAVAAATKARGIVAG